MKKEKLSPLEKIEKINKQIEKLKKQQQDVQKTFESKIIKFKVPPCINKKWTKRVRYRICSQPWKFYGAFHRYEYNYWN